MYVSTYEFFSFFGASVTRYTELTKTTGGVCKSRDGVDAGTADVVQALVSVEQ